MRFFVDSPNVYASVNAKGKAMNEWISTFTHVLLLNELSRDAFIEGIRLKAAMLDKEYPRSKKLYVSVGNISDTNHVQIMVYPEQCPNKLVFILSIYLVRGEFRFNESDPLAIEGGKL